MLKDFVPALHPASNRIGEKYEQINPNSLSCRNKDTLHPPPKLPASDMDTEWYYDFIIPYIFLCARCFGIRILHVHHSVFSIPDSKFLAPKDSTFGTY
jgi:hypothetical protein